MPAPAEQFRVRAHPGDAAILDHQDPIGSLDRRETVCDDERGGLRKALERQADVAFAKLMRTNSGWRVRTSAA